MRISTSKIIVSALTATALTALVPAAVSAQQAAPALITDPVAAAAAGLTKPIVSPKAPRAPDGHASLNGTWTNVSITQLERSSQYGVRKALTKEEASRLEGGAVQRFIDGNKPTDPNAGSIDTTSKQCQGAGGLDCGYNSGWKDSGTTVVRINGEPRTSFITFPANGRIPTMPGARPLPRGGGEGGEEGGAPRGRGGINDNPENHSTGERCLTSFGYSAGPVMMPLMYNNNYEFVQTKDNVAILVEMVHDVRTIRIGAKHRTDGVRPWYGDSIGHWEGNTLVSETTNFPAAQSFRGSSANLKVTEKFTRVDNDRLLYQFIVEDPTVWAAPWGGEYEFSPTKGIVYEYACHEGNYALEGMLAGAREEEREAAAHATEKPRADAGSAATAAR
jgi:hypothetical protein